MRLKVGVFWKLEQRDRLMFVPTVLLLQKTSVFLMRWFTGPFVAAERRRGRVQDGSYLNMKINLVDVTGNFCVTILLYHSEIYYL